MSKRTNRLIKPLPRTTPTPPLAGIARTAPEELRLRQIVDHVQHGLALGNSYLPASPSWRELVEHFIEPDGRPRGCFGPELVG
jgi:hypothetical protein